jgi:hypothetical protein
MAFSDSMSGADASKASWTRQHAAFVLLFAAACYHHERPAEPPKNQVRPSLIRPTEGRYAITRGTDRVGEERFTITSSNARWTLAGNLELAWPVEQTRGYMLTIDERSLEPIAFSMWIEILGERQEVKGVRQADHFTVHAKTIAGEHQRDVPYGPGTVVDFDSTPLLNTLVLSLLGPSLEVGHPVPVRTILISLPRLDATVLVEMYELRGKKDDLELVAVHPLGALRPTALWVRPDGLPVLVRSWIDDGPPFELKLEGSPSASTRDSSPSATGTSSTTALPDR